MSIHDDTITTPDGRQLKITQAGAPDGIPVLAHHGTPESRVLNQGWIEDAHARGIRLISYNRPGYGASTALPGRSVADAAADVRAIAGALGLKRLLVWGVSGGGPHALACAALLPDLVPAAAALASPAPYGAEGLDWMAGMGEDNILEFGAALQGEAPLRQFIEPMAAEIINALPLGLVQAFQTLLCPSDVQAFTPQFAAFMLERMREGISHSREGWVHDDQAFMKPWGFDLSQVRVPVLVVHGDQDRMVPFAHGPWLAGHIPGAQALFIPGDGHITLSAYRVPQVHAWLLERW